MRMMLGRCSFHVHTSLKTRFTIDFPFLSTSAKSSWTRICAQTAMKLREVEQRRRTCTENRRPSSTFSSFSNLYLCLP
jgi:hypothetical protein